MSFGNESYIREINECLAESQFKVDELDLVYPQVTLCGEDPRWSLSFFCPWVLSSQGTTISSSEEPEGEEVFGRLTGQRLLRTEEATGTRFVFDRAILELFEDDPRGETWNFQISALGSAFYSVYREPFTS